MNAIKIALLGTAALAAVSVSARADDLSDLKAQIEALNGRISQLEATPSVPAGYQLLSVAKAPAIVVPSLDIDNSYGATATNVGILPTADVPASTNVQWVGFARAALVHYREKWSASLPVVPAVIPGNVKDLDIFARGQVKVTGTTDTSVGTVGATVTLRGNFDGHGNAGVTMPEAWGWWAMTPELTLGAGYTGTLANIGYGYDGSCNCYYTDGAPVGLNPGDTTQMRLSYASGPLSFAIALEDASQNVTAGIPYKAAAPLRIAGNHLGAAGEIKYAGDAFSAEVSAGWWNTGGELISKVVPYSNAPIDKTSDSYQVGIGAGFNIGDMAKISTAAGMGRLVDGSKYWKASILASANLSDSVHAEIAYGHANFGSHVDVVTTAYKSKTDAFLAGIYYDPVAQLTIGLEGEWSRSKFSGMGATIGTAGTGGAKVTTSQVDLVTVFRF